METRLVTGMIGAVFSVLCLEAEIAISLNVTDKVAGVAIVKQKVSRVTTSNS